MDTNILGKHLDKIYPCDGAFGCEFCFTDELDNSLSRFLLDLHRHFNFGHSPARVLVIEAVKNISNEN